MRFLGLDLETLGLGINEKNYMKKEGWKDDFHCVLNEIQKMYITNAALAKQDKGGNMTYHSFTFGKDTMWNYANETETNFYHFMKKNGSDSFLKIISYFFQETQEAGRTVIKMRYTTLSCDKKWAEFLMLMQKHCEEDGWFIGYNKFDLRILEKMMPFGPILSTLSDNALSIRTVQDRKKWVETIDSDFIDMLTELDKLYALHGFKATDFKAGERTLEQTCLRNGISEGKGGLNGEQAIDMALAGNWKDLNDYNKCDAGLHLKLYVQIMSQEGFFLPERLDPEQRLWPLDRKRKVTDPA